MANPADIFMRVLSVKYPKTQQDEAKLLLFNKCYKEQQESEVQGECDWFKCPQLKIKNISEVRASFYSQLSILMWRSSVFAKREP
jgi:hypothetical protein